MKPDVTSYTWKDKEQCKACQIQDKLNCRWKLSDLMLFMACAFPPMLGCLTGTILIWIVKGIWWPAVSYVLFFPIVLGVAESRFLCSHCPYYAQKGRVLHCLANYGILKIWKYHPEPMNKLEKLLMIFLAALFLFFMPLSIFGYTIRLFFVNTSLYGIPSLACVIGLFIVTIGSLISLAFVMVKHICSLCINFSCPFNQVKKEQVDAYLKKNEIMKKAWEESGYRIEPAADKGSIRNQTKG